MSDPGKLLEQTNRAMHAKNLLENELLVEAFSTLEKAYIERWKSTHIDDDKGRERLFVAINVVGKVRSHLEAIVNIDGKLAQAELNQIAEAGDRRKKFGII